MTKTKAFEICRIQLNMKSANVHTTHINRVTAPEFLIIKSIHGEGAATIKESQGDDIEKRMDESGKWMQRIRPVSSLVDHLINKYGKERFSKVFPGENPILPFTYEDAGLREQATEEEFDSANGWEPLSVAAEEEEAPAKLTTKEQKLKKLDDLVGEKTAA